WTVRRNDRRAVREFPRTEARRRSLREFSGMPMKCVSALSTARGANTAFHQIRERLDEALGDSPADLTLIFASRHHAEKLGELSRAFLEQGRSRRVLGCLGEAIIGEDREVEGKPALA